MHPSISSSFRSSGPVIFDGDVYYDAPETLAPRDGGSTRHVTAAAPPTPYVPSPVEYVAPPLPVSCRDAYHLGGTYFDATGIAPGVKNWQMRTRHSPDVKDPFIWAALLPQNIKILKESIIKEHLDSESKKKNRRLGTVGTSAASTQDDE